MISTQRLLIIVILTNLILSLALSVYGNSNNEYDDVFIGEFHNESVRQETAFESDVGIWGSLQDEDNLNEDSIGNSVHWGKVILDTFTGMVIPLPLEESLFDNELEKEITNIIRYMLQLVQFILILEAYFVFKNKKTS